MLNEHSVTAITRVCGISNYCTFMHIWAHSTIFPTLPPVHPQLDSPGRRR